MSTPAIQQFNHVVADLIKLCDGSPETLAQCTVQVERMLRVIKSHELPSPIPIYLPSPSPQQQQMVSPPLRPLPVMHSAALSQSVRSISPVVAAAASPSSSSSSASSFSSPKSAAVLPPLRCHSFDQHHGGRPLSPMPQQQVRCNTASSYYPQQLQTVCSRLSLDPDLNSNFSVVPIRTPCTLFTAHQ